MNKRRFLHATATALACTLCLAGAGLMPLIKGAR